MPHFPVPAMRSLPFLVAAVAVTFVGVAASAQSFTDAELRKMFETQRDAFRAASQSGTGRTRGLTLITVDDVAVGSESPALAAPEGGEAGAGVTASQGGGVTVGLAPLAPEAGAPDAAPEPSQPVVFGQLAPELQVNVHIRFGFDSAALTPDQTPLLAQLCTVMKGSDIQLFRIVGHTDATGSAEYNSKLSQLRADEVRRYLVGDCGIAPDRLEAVGLGERFLADEAHPDAAENRRVEFQALS